jgi:hypothetical protein
MEEIVLSDEVYIDNPKIVLNAWKYLRKNS